MSINNIPTELFTKVLNYIPLKDAISIMLVNREWNQEYRAVIYSQYDVKFKELLHSHWSDWNISVRMVHHLYWHRFLANKLYSFSKSFDINILEEPKCINNSLEIESHKLAKEEKVIKDLLDRYEASPDFEGWFPEWLWERRRKNRYNSAICSGDKHLSDNILDILIQNLWFNEVIL